MQLYNAPTSEVMLNSSLAALGVGLITSATTIVPAIQYMVPHTQQRHFDFAELQMAHPPALKACSWRLL